MWIASDRLQLIDAALEGGRRDDVDRLLADILTSDPAPEGIPTACATSSGTRCPPWGST